MQIEVRNVNFSYDKKENILKNINVTFCDKKITAIIGKTGSGKSTLVQLLNGLLIPDSGSVLVGDFEIAKSNKKNLKKISHIIRKVGIVFQYPEYQLFEETVLKDVMFGPRNFGLKDDEAIEVSKKALSLLGMNESYYEKSPFELSGGEKRKVAIAGILASEPEVIIFDEPTVGLDKISKKNIISLIKKLNKNGKTIIIISHDIEVVNCVADNVIVLKNGEVAIDTTKEKLFKMKNIEKYSIDYPFVYKFINNLNNNGYKKDLSDINSLDSLLKRLGDNK